MSNGQDRLSSGEPLEAEVVALGLERLRADDRRWAAVLKPTLGLLLVAGAPLSALALRALLGAEEASVQAGLELLGGVVREDAAGHYALAHPRIADLLRYGHGRQGTGAFADAELLASHRRLAAWCDEGRGGLDAVWQDVPDDALEQERRVYARRHYIPHLAAARMHAELWAALDTSAYSSAKRRHDPSLHSYALDLDVARQAVIDAAGTVDEQAEALPRLWRYSLLRLALADQYGLYRLELLRALVALGRVAEAVGRAELMSDLERKSGALLAIGEALLPRDRAQALAVLHRAGAVADSIPDLEARAPLLSFLAVTLAQASALFSAERAFDLARATTAEREHPFADGPLIRSLVAAGHLESARRVVDDIADAGRRAQALGALAEALARAGQFDGAAAIVGDLGDEAMQRSAVLRALAEGLAQDGQLGRARAAADAIDNEVLRGQALAAIGAALAGRGEPAAAEQVFAQASALAASIDDEYQRDLVLDTLARAYGGRLEHARAVTDTIADGEIRASNLGTLAGLLIEAGQDELAEETLAAALAAATYADHEEGAHDCVLARFAQALARAGHYERARAVAGSLRNQLHRVGALGELATALAAAGQSAMAEAVVAEANTTIAASIDDEVSEALAALTTALVGAGRLADARVVASTIADGWWRAAAFGALGEALAQAPDAAAADAAFAEAGAAARAITSEWGRTGALADLAETLARAGRAAASAGIFAEVRAAADALTVKWQQAEALGALAASLARAGHLDLAHATVQAIKDEWEREEALAALADEQPSAPQAARGETPERPGDVAQLVRLLGAQWRDAETREELVQRFTPGAALLRAYPSLGLQFLESFTWVVDRLATRP